MTLYDSAQPGEWQAASTLLQVAARQRAAPSRRGCQHERQERQSPMHDPLHLHKAHTTRVCCMLSQRCGQPDASTLAILALANMPLAQPIC